MLNLTEEVQVKTPRARRTKKDSVEVAPVPVKKETEKTFGVIAVDNGGHNTKVISEDMDQPISFKSDKKRGVEYNLEEMPLPTRMETHSFVVKWNDKVYLTNRRMNLMPKFDGMTGNVASKANDYFILSALIGVALYGYDINFLVTSIPYEHKAKKEENDKIKERLLGEHHLIIDGESYEFEIVYVQLAIEAQAGQFYLQEEGITTLLEIGSRTVGFATSEFVRNEDGLISIDQPILEKTGTLSRKGVEISDIQSKEEYELYVYDIFKSLSKKIDEDDKIVAFGGGVLIDAVKETLEEVYSNIKFADNPLFVQVLGMLEIGKLRCDLEFGEDNE